MCPGCGRSVALKNFDPENLDLDVMVQDMKGLGRGKGFESTGRSSILGKNDVCERIADRSIALLKLFIDHDVVTAAEVRKRLELPGTVTVVERNEDEVQALRERIEEREKEITSITSDMADAMGESVDDYEGEGHEEDDIIIARLRHYSVRLTDEHEAMTDKEGVSPADSINEITSEIAEALGESADDYEPDDGEEGGGPLGKLRHFVSRMIDEHSGMKANAEEEQ